MRNNYKCLWGWIFFIADPVTTLIKICLITGVYIFHFGPPPWGGGIIWAFNGFLGKKLRKKEKRGKGREKGRGKGKGGRGRRKGGREKEKGGREKEKRGKRKGKRGKEREKGKKKGEEGRKRGSGNEKKKEKEKNMQNLSGLALYSDIMFPPFKNLVCYCTHSWL